MGEASPDRTVRYDPQGRTPRRGFRAIQRSGSGSHLRTRWFTHGSSVSRRRCSGSGRASRTAGEVRRRHAGADVAARPGRARSRDRAAVAAPVARHAQHARPGVVDAASRGRGEEADAGSRAARSTVCGWVAPVRRRCPSRTGTGRLGRRSRSGRRRCAGRTCRRGRSRRALAPLQPMSSQIGGERLGRDQRGVHRQPERGAGPSGRR